MWSRAHGSVYLQFLFPNSDCIVLLKQRPFGRGLEVTRFTAGGDSPGAVATFTIDSPQKGKVENFHIVRHEGKYLVSAWDTVVPGR